MKVTLSSGDVFREKLRFQAIVDLDQRKLHFFSDNLYLLRIYNYRLGNANVVTTNAQQLEKQLGKLIAATEDQGELRVWDQEGLVFRVTALNSEHAEMQVKSRFPIIKSELQTNDPQSPVLWVRNGKIVEKHKGVVQGGGYTCLVPMAEIRRAKSASPES